MFTHNYSLILPISSYISNAPPKGKKKLETHKNKLTCNVKEEKMQTQIIQANQSKKEKVYIFPKLHTILFLNNLI
jgi:hypothetical protein